MQAQTIVKSTIIHTSDGHWFEVVNCIEELERTVDDKSISPNAFVQLDFYDGARLRIKKESIIAFYESE